MNPVCALEKLTALSTFLSLHRSDKDFCWFALSRLHSKDLTLSTCIEFSELVMAQQPQDDSGKCVEEVKSSNYYVISQLAFLLVNWLIGVAWVLAQKCKRSKNDRLGNALARYHNDHAFINMNAPMGSPLGSPIGSPIGSPTGSPLVSPQLTPSFTRRQIGATLQARGADGTIKTFIRQPTAIQHQPTNSTIINLEEVSKSFVRKLHK